MPFFTEMSEAGGLKLRHFDWSNLDNLESNLLSLTFGHVPKTKCLPLFAGGERDLGGACDDHMPISCAERVFTSPGSAVRSHACFSRAVWRNICSAYPVTKPRHARDGGEGVCSRPGALSIHISPSPVFAGGDCDSVPACAGFISIRRAEKVFSKSGNGDIILSKKYLHMPRPND